MKLTKHTSKVLLALIGLVTSASQVRAATTTFSADDLFLGFRLEGTNKSYLLDIGQVSQYRFASGSIVLNTGATVANSTGTITGIGSAANIAADLATVFGSGWATDANLKWGIVGTSGASAVNTGAYAGANADPANTLYATIAESTYGTQVTPTDSSFFRQPSLTQGNNARAAIVTMENSGYAGQTTQTGGLLSPVAVTDNGANSTSWSTYMPGGSNTTSGSFNYFNPSVEGNVSAAGGAALDLFRMQASNLAVSGGLGTVTAGSTAGTYIGSFSLASNGTITFGTAPPTVGAAPEPGRALLMGVGAVTMLLRRRRKSANI